MFSTSRDQLFTLVKSLSKAEKRNFKLYANRFQSGQDSKFIQLFDVLDRLPEYDDEQILRRLPDVKKRHLPNLKRHLYKQILISLRLIYIKKNIDIQIREQIDFARILYGKGMYMQALKLLDRIKQIAEEHHQDILHLEILEFEKLIEARHITRSRTVKNKMEDLLDASALRSYVTHTTSRLSNLNIQVQGWYIQHGHVKNEEELTEVKAYYDSIFPDDLDLESLTFLEKINLFQSEMWYHYIRLDFPACRREALRWVKLFEENPQIQEKDPDLYMRGLYYLLIFLFFLEEAGAFDRYLQQFEAFVRKYEDRFNANSRMIAFVYLNLSRLNQHFLKGRYKQGLYLVPEIQEGINAFEEHTDAHRILLFYYKIAYLHFGCGHFEEALDYLNKITTLQSGFLRDDLHFNARLLHLICHYEIGNYDLLEYLIPSVQRTIEKGRDTSRWQKAALEFIRELNKRTPAERPAAFGSFQEKIKELAGDPFEQKEILYLDIPSWVESHLQQCSIQELRSRERLNIDK